MQHEERDEALIFDMVQFCREVVDYTAGMSFETYAAVTEKRRSVERVVELIGEAASHVSASFRIAHPEISWKALVGQRNVLIHGYADVDNARVWKAATEDAPRLLEMLQPLLPK
jgi:uncharacterized protein with HEPN domain